MSKCVNLREAGMDTRMSKVKPRLVKKTNRIDYAGLPAGALQSTIDEHNARMEEITKRVRGELKRLGLPEH